MPTDRDERAGNYRLERATLADVAELMTWFDDAETTRAWGGPTVDFPMVLTTLLPQMQWEALGGWALRSDDTPLLAFGQYYLREGCGHLARLAVAPTLRSRGLGSTLIQVMMADIRERHGCAQFSLFVLEGNERAQGCYRRNGFEVISQHDEPGLGRISLMRTGDVASAPSS